MSKLCTSC